MRYSGMLGISEQKEVDGGVWEEVITEHKVSGTVTQRTETVEQGDSILPRYRTTTTVSVLSRGIGIMDNSGLRYLTMSGKKWVISTHRLRYPRLILYIGEEYHGPGPADPPVDA